MNGNSNVFSYFLIFCCYKMGNYLGFFSTLNYLPPRTVSEDAEIEVESSFFKSGAFKMVSSGGSSRALITLKVVTNEKGEAVGEVLTIIC